jgi:replicative DNA helicase
MNDVPYSRESEYSVLGSVMHSPELMPEAMSLVDPSDFFSLENRELFNMMMVLAKKDIQVDVLSLADMYRNKGQGRADGHMEYLSIIEDYMPTGTMLAHHCKKIKGLKIQRDLIDSMQTIMQQAGQITDDPVKLLEEAHGKVFKLMQAAESNATYKDVYGPEEMAELGYKNAKRMFESPSDGAGHTTGFPIIDKHIKWLKDYNLIAASTGVGKTGLAINIALNVALQKAPILYVNLEMNIDEMIIRILSILSGVEMDQIITGEYGDKPENFQLVARFAEELERRCLYMTDNKPKTIDHIISMIGKYHAKHNIKVVVIDYIGHIANDRLAYKENNKRTSLGRYSQALKHACTKLGIKMVIVAQMNREGEKEAEMYNIGECYQLAQDADIFMILYYEWIKNTDEEPGAPEQYKQYLLNLRKNRNGPAPRTIKLNYNERTQLMTEGEI